MVILARCHEKKKIRAQYIVMVLVNLLLFYFIHVINESLQRFLLDANTVNLNFSSSSNGQPYLANEPIIIYISMDLKCLLLQYTVMWSRFGFGFSKFISLQT